MKIILALLITFWSTIFYGQEFPISAVVYNQRRPAIAFDGTNYLVVWEDSRNGVDYDIYGTRITQAGEILDPQGIPISTAPWAQLNPEVAFDGTNYLVVWEDRRDGFGERIYGARVSKDGVVLDPNGILISVLYANLHNPAVCFSNTHYLVVWEFWWPSYSLEGTRVTTEGVVLDPQPLYIFPSSSLSDIPTAPFIYSEPWGWTVYCSWKQDIYFRKVYLNGHMPSPSAFDDGPVSQSYPAVAEIDGRRLVVWAEFWEPTLSFRDIIGKFHGAGTARFDISTAPGVQDRPALAVGNSEFFVTWHDRRNSLYDIYGARISVNGDVLEQDGAPICVAPDSQKFPKVGFADNNYLVVWQDKRNGDWDIYGALIKKPGILTNDPMALAYNGNRHLVRNPNSTELHLVYTDNGDVLYRHTPYHLSWSNAVVIGQGKFPAIVLSSNGLPAVCWTDENGGLWFRRKINHTQWSEIYHLYDPWGIFQPKLNSPPSIAITSHTTGDSVHIITTLHNPANGPVNVVWVYSFRIDQPMAGSFSEIEGGVGINAGAIRYNPSIACANLNNSLHAVWQRADTICYATRLPGQTWQNWGPQFQQWGLQSAHPFVETYGDMVYVVWEHKQTPGAPEEVYKGWRQIPRDFSWDNISLTPNTSSRYPVSASGTFTVFKDSPYPPINGPEIYYKLTPNDTLNNISKTVASSSYPHTATRFTPSGAMPYIVWLEGDEPPYQILCNKYIWYTHIQPPPYITSYNGSEIPSPYLVARDSFISNWQVPVDVGYQTITYQFPLEPGYRYKMKVVAYHQSSGQWREWIKIDNRWKQLIKYNAYKPETLEFWVPPAFYQDGKIEIVFNKISGSYATAGPIYVYQYEYEEETTAFASGSMAQKGRPLNSSAVKIFPNPFKDKLDIRYQVRDNQSFQSLVNIKIYDVAGRLIKQFNYPTIQPFNQLVWDGKDESNRTVSPGVYFIAIENTATKETSCHKVIKVE